MSHTDQTSLPEAARGQHEPARRHALRRLSGAAAACALPWTVARAAERGIAARELVVGQNITLQAGKNEYGRVVSDGIRLVIDAVNAAGGVFNRRVTIRTLDDDNKSTQAEANAQRLVDEGCFVLFGSVEGGPSTAVAKVASEAKVPFFGPMAGSPTLRRPYLEMVFPVRAEHRDEFRALMEHGHSHGGKSVAFFHSDSEVGRQHLVNVRTLADQLGLKVSAPLPFKSDPSDADIDAMAQAVARAGADMIFNHGSIGPYGRLLRRLKHERLHTAQMAVNSGSSQLAKSLGELAHGMVFAQVVPSPWERKSAITREYQEAARRADPNAEFSYGALEGFLTAKALVLALRAAGPQPTRAGLVTALHGSSFDLGGVKVQWRPGDHEGSRFVDLAMYSREGRFIQ